MTPSIQYTRPDLEVIFDLIEPNSTVLDLGCGSGDLLFKLMQEKNVQGHGIELFDEYVFDCVGKGVPVVHQDLDEGLGEYHDKSFDYVVLSQTLQQVRHPDRIIRDMLRVGRLGIVSLLNFGYWRVRHYLTWRGEMPISKVLPYKWYDTPNIHLSTLRDFQRLCAESNIDIKKQINLVHRKQNALFANLHPNSFAELAVFVLQLK